MVDYCRRLLECANQAAKTEDPENSESQADDAPVPEPAESMQRYSRLAVEGIEGAAAVALPWLTQTVSNDAPTIFSLEGG